MGRVTFVSAPDLVFLDYDGVLHPADVWAESPTEIKLSTPGHQLFESAPLLAQLLEPYPSVRIILSSNWVRKLGFSRTRDRLPLALRVRVNGATFDPSDPDAWCFDCPYDAIMATVAKRRPARWLAIDDQVTGWPAAERDHLVVVPPGLGLRSQSAIEDLRSRLADRF